MNLLAPLALLGLLGLGLPLLAHLLGRAPPQRVPFAGLRFLRTSEPVVTRRRELRDRALLALRLLLLALIVLILARPVARSEAAVAVLAEPHDAMILLDASGSMELRIDGQNERERALERVDALLDALPPGSRVGLTSSDPRAPQVALGEASDSAAQIRAALDAWMDASSGGPRAGAWTLAEALPRASAELSEVDERPRVIYAVGDATARGLASLPSVTAGAVSVVPVPTRGRPGDDPAAMPEHVGLRALEWEPAPELGARAVRVRALIHRYGGDSDGAPEQLEVLAALEIDDREVARTRASLRANGEAAAEFTHVLADTGERASVRLLEREDDPFPVDDRRHLWLDASDALEVLTINGDPSETRTNDEIFFFSTAIASSELAERIELRALTLDQLEERLAKHLAKHPGGEPDPLAEVDVLVFANVRAITPELAPGLLARVEQGMGLLIAVGDRVSAVDYNDRYSALLPLRLREAVYAGTAPGRTEARSEGIAPVQLSHPIFTGATSEELEFDATRTQRMFLLEPDPRRDADIAVTFTSGAPALVTRAHGQGQVALLTTTLDRDWGDLPLRPGFVPLVTRTLTWLGQRQGAGRAAQVTVAASKRLARGGPYVVTTPSGARTPIAAAREGEAVTFEETDTPGHYRAQPRLSVAPGARAADEETDSERFVVSFDAREAETATQTIARAEALASESGATVTIYAPRWRELALLALVLLALESFARIWLARRPRERRAREG